MELGGIAPLVRMVQVIRPVLCVRVREAGGEEGEGGGGEGGAVLCCVCLSEGGGGAENDSVRK